MGMKISMNVVKLKEELRAAADVLNKATRPAAQAGAQIIYDRVKSITSTIRSKHEHMFHGTHGVYGPYKPGNLHDSIYQAFSKDNSFKDVSTYHVSWNSDKAPYGAMVEFGTKEADESVRAPAQSFIGRAVKETRAEVRRAIKERFIEEVNKK